MANVLVDENSLQSIANAIREKNGTEETYKPSQMPQAIRDIPSGGGGFDADAYFEQKFIEATKNNPNANMGSLFQNSYVDDISFKPTHDMQPTSAIHMFNNCKITNLKQILEDRGVVLDTSQCTTLQNFIAYSTITHLPCISLESCTYAPTMFGYAVNLVYIQKIITNRNSGWVNNTLVQCVSLETIEEIEGEIGTSFNIASSPKLDDLTIDNIVNAYADMTGQTAPILTVHATVKAKIVADDEKDDTDPTKRFWLRTLTSKNVTLA